MKKFYNKNPKSFNNIQLTEEYKKNIQNNSYIGHKGYSIPKKFLSDEDLDFLKKELYVKPIIFGVAANTDNNAFYVYRESSSKIFLPRFYGIQRYGLPLNNQLTTGQDINVPFVKDLRDFQTNIVNVYTNYVNSPISVNDIEFKGNGGILEVPCGKGKTVMALKIISLLQKKNDYSCS